MAEAPDRESKTEEPTEKKIGDALEQGNVPASREAGTLASLLGILIVASFFLVSGVAHIKSSLSGLSTIPAAGRSRTAPMPSASVPVHRLDARACCCRP